MVRGFTLINADNNEKSVRVVSSLLAGFLRLLGLLLIVLLPLGGVAAAPAVDGDPDPGFGAGGVTTTGFSAPSDDAGWKLLVQPDGKLVMAGTYNHGARTLAVARFLADGTPDVSFGQSGWAYARYGWTDILMMDAALQPDGKIVAAGTLTRPGETYPDFALARFTAAGQVDPSFGEQGVVITDFGLDRQEQLNAVAIQPDGKIVAAGYTSINTVLGGEEAFARPVAVARYSPDGSLDASFDQDGLLVLKDRLFGASDMAIQADGKIVILVGEPERNLVRLNGDGSLDAGFGAGGAVSATNAGALGRTALALDGERILIASQSPNYGQAGLQLSRWNADGSPDASFGDDGLADIGFSIDFNPYAFRLYELAVQPDGRLLAGFHAPGESGQDLGDFGALRINPDGSLDASFGENGWLMEGFSNQDGSTGIGLLPDGSFWLGGFKRSPSGDRDFFLRHYSAAGHPDPAAAPGLDLGAGSTAANTGVWADGGILAAGWRYGKPGRLGLGKQALAARYTDAGELGSYFSASGVSPLGGDFTNTEWSDMLRLPDGRLLLGGTGWDREPEWGDYFEEERDVLLARFYPDGRLDTTFGKDGLVTIDWLYSLMNYHLSNDRLHAIALQPDGKILLAGGMDISLSGDNNVFFNAVLARLTRDGQLDPTFGGKGLFLVDDASIQAPNVPYFAVNDLLVQPDGKIVAAGQQAMYGQFSQLPDSYRFLAARYNADGTPDADFGEAGLIYADVSGQPEKPQGARAAALQPNGRLVLAGYATAGTQRDVALVRLTRDGGLDSSFSGDGKLLLDFAGGFDQANDLLLLPDGKVLAGGFSGLDGGRRFALARFTSAGSLDSGFGSGGRLTLAVGESGPRTDSLVNKLVLQPDGKYVAIGQAWVGNSYQMALVRLQAFNGRRYLPLISR